MPITYHAVFQYDDDGICISFPDVPAAITCACSFEEGLHMAKDVLELVLYGTAVSDLPSARPDLITPGENRQIVPITAEMEDRGGILWCAGVTEF